MYTQNRDTGRLTEISSATLGNSPQESATNGRFVYVPDNGAPFNINVFSIESGSLVALQTRTVTIGNPNWARLHPSGAFLYAGDTAGMIEIFAITGDGTIVSSSTFDTGLIGALDEMVIHPSGNFAYVIANASSTLLTCAIGSDGSLTLIDSTTNTLTSPLGLTLDPEQRFLYASNSGVTTISAFDVRGGIPISVGSSATTDFPFQTQFAPAPGNFAYSVSFAGSSLAVLRVDHETGLLTEETRLSGFTFPALARPDASGQFLYLSENTGGDRLRTYAIDPRSNMINELDSFTLPVAGDIFIVGEVIQE